MQNDTKLKWKLLESQSLVKDEWIDFRKEAWELPDGSRSEPYYNYSRRSYSVIVPRDTEGNWICVRQFRHGIRKVTNEFPAGGIETGAAGYENTDEKEDALVCAKRELQEETGYTSDHWIHLISLPSAATIADNTAHLFFADGCHKISEQKLDDTEFLEVKTCTTQEIDELIQSGNFEQAMHVLAWELTRHHI